jgi:hypothetical protein
MSYKSLTLFFPFPYIIPIIMSYLELTPQELLREKINIEIRRKALLKDIKSRFRD